MQTAVSAGPRDWNKLVEQTKNSPQPLHFVPDTMLDEVKAWHEKRQAFYVAANELAKAENELGNMFNNIIFKMRQAFEERGLKDIWTKDIGFNTEALKEGKYIVSFTDSQALK